jgi:hypothetical protein
MFFGLCNSPSTFQQMMDDIFKDMILAGEIVIYLDDILIYKGTTLEEHQRVVRKVLDRLRDNHLYLKAEKCTFDAQEVEYLGNIVRFGKFRMDPVKIQAIKEWPIPLNVKDVQTFLGFTNSIGSTSRNTPILRGFCHGSRARSPGNGMRSNRKHLIGCTYHSRNNLSSIWLDATESSRSKPMHRDLHAVEFSISCKMDIGSLSRSGVTC